MGANYALGRKAFGYCDRCGQRSLLSKLKAEVVKGKVTGVHVCGVCFDPDQPQLHLGETPVYDPQALRDPRPNDNLTESRDFQWGWDPVGGGSSESDTPNDLVADSAVGTVTVTVT
jgi:hypothetical protein